MADKPTCHDSYIQAAADFAKPILIRVRALYHQACPEIEETIKWGVPHFEYKGMVGSMSAFKKHVNLGFWKGALMADPQGIFTAVGNAKISLIKLTHEKELPEDGVLLDYIRQAVQLNIDEVKAPKSPKSQAPPPETPQDLAQALTANPKAQEVFDGFTPSQKREYIEWLTEAKRQATRQKRLEQAVIWIAEGKQRNWKYMNC